MEAPEKAPEELTDEELDAKLAGDEALEAPQEETPKEEEQKPDVPESEEAPEASDTPEEPEQEPEGQEPAEEPKISNRAKKRAEKLAFNKLVEEQYRRVRPQAPQGPQGPQTAQEALDYAQALEADPQTLQALEADRQNYGNLQRQQGYQEAQQTAQQQLQTTEWRTMLHIDAPQVEQRYEFLNSKDEKNFHPALADTLNNFYLGMSGFDPQTQTVQNPRIRYSEFIDGVVELAEEIASTRVAESSKNIARQAASAGLRPDGSSPKRLNLNQAPENMSDEELDAVISQSVPRR